MKKSIMIKAAAVFLATMMLSGCGSSNAPADRDAGKETAPAAQTPAAEAKETAEAAGAAVESKGGETVGIVIEVRGFGTIKAELYPDVAPITVENFVKIADSGFYDGLTFHRIIPGFMIQGGDPNGNGTGGLDETIKGEFASNGVQNDLKHVRGVLSMARSMDPDSASCQFFIVHEDSPFLDGEYAAFGKVTEGIEVVDRICESTPIQDQNGSVLPDDQPVIESIKVVR